MEPPLVSQLLLQQSYHPLFSLPPSLRITLSPFPLHSNGPQYASKKRQHQRYNGAMETMEAMLEGNVNSLLTPSSSFLLLVTHRPFHDTQKRFPSTFPNHLPLTTMKKINVANPEFKTLISSVFSVCEKRTQTAKSDALDEKDGVDYKLCKRLISGVDESISSKLRKVVDSRKVEDPSGDALIDKEAVERVAAISKDLTVVSESVVTLRKEVRRRQVEVEEKEEAATAEVEKQVQASLLDESASGSSENAAQDNKHSDKHADLSTMKRLLDLAQKMPAKMEGFEKTLDSVNQGVEAKEFGNGQGKCEVEAAIRGDASTNNVSNAENMIPVHSNNIPTQSTVAAKSPAVAVAEPGAPVEGAEDAFADFMAR